MVRKGCHPRKSGSTNSFGHPLANVIGVRKDDDEAFYWFHQSAMSKAFYWFEKAALLDTLKHVLI